MTVSGYLRREKRRLDTLAAIPGVRIGAEGALYGGGAMLLCAVGYPGKPLPLGAVLALVSPGWRRVPAALGAMAGYWLLDGQWLGILWTISALLLGVALQLGRKDTFWIMTVGSLMLPAVVDTALRVPMAAVWADSLWGGLGGGLFFLVPRVRDPVLFWAAAGLLLRALACLGALPLAGAMAAVCCGSLPAAVLLGLPLETAGLPGITAGLCGGHLAAKSILPQKWRCLAVSGTVGVLGMCLGRSWNIGAWLGVSMGGLLAVYFPWKSQTLGTGGARVQLELAARTLEKMNRALLELPGEREEDNAQALERLRSEACEECPKGKSCTRKTQLDESVFLDPWSFSCERTGRLLREARRVKERQRMLVMQHRRLTEYRMALARQYGMLSRYLQRVADRLPLGCEKGRIRYRVSVSVRSRGKHRVDGDCCAAFPGLTPKFYVLLCDGCGTGPEAAAEAGEAVGLLRQMLTAGLPPRYALGSLNGFLVLTGRTGAVTADLAELRLDSGSALLYKWGAAPSYLMRRNQVKRLWGGSLPPGVSMEDRGERIIRLSLKRGETLVMASDGVALDDSFLREDSISSTGALAEKLLKECGSTGEDDATLAVVRLGELMSNSQLP